MFTPQEVQEKTFNKAVFGGYDMGCVDDFLEPLTQDYITIYKENSILKSKLKSVVEKLEEYRNQEEAMKNALFTAQKTADTVLQEAELKAKRIVSDAECTVQNKTLNVQSVVDAEEQRAEKARQAAATFIEIIEKDVARHLELLQNLKLMNLEKPAPRAFDFDRHPAKGLEKPAPVQVETEEPKADVVAEIAENIGRLVDDGGDLSSTRVATRETKKYPELQFGKNYDTIP